MHSKEISKMMFLVTAFLILALGLSLTPTVMAQAQEDDLYVLMVIDDSGSMQGTDGRNLRLVAAKLLLSMLEPTDQAAIVRFSTKSEIIAPFTPMEAAAKQDLIAQLDESFYSDGLTDMQAALVQAESVLADLPDGVRGRIIFLTDGVPDIAAWNGQTPAADVLERYLSDTLEIAERLGLPIFTVGLGSDVDAVFLEAISETTKGRFFAANNSLDLPEVYLAMLSAMQDRTVVGPGPVTAPEEAMVVVHPYAQRVGFVIVKEIGVSVSLYPPDAPDALDVTVSGGRAFTDAQYEVIVLADVVPGTWRVVLDGSGQANVNAIIINSRLQLELADSVSEAACLGRAWELQGRLYLEDENGEQVVVDRTFNAEITLPDGTVQTVSMHNTEEDGVHGGTFADTEQTGVYEVVLLAKVSGLDVRQTTEVTARDCPEPTAMPTPQPPATSVPTATPTAVPIPQSTKPPSIEEPPSTPVEPWWRQWIQYSPILPVLGLIMFGIRTRQLRLKGELRYSMPGQRPLYEPLKGKKKVFAFEGGYLEAVRREKDGHLVVEARAEGTVMRSINDGELVKDGIPVDVDGTAVQPTDKLRLKVTGEHKEVDIRFQNDDLS